MTAAILLADETSATPDTDDIPARSWAMVEAALDSVPDRLVLLHAAMMLMASLAYGQSDPIAALEEMLADQSVETMDILRIALAMGAETPTTETPATERKS